MADLAELLGDTGICKWGKAFFGLMSQRGAPFKYTSLCMPVSAVLLDTGSRIMSDSRCNIHVRVVMTDFGGS